MSDFQILSTRGKKAKAQDAFVVRELGDVDLPLILDPPAVLPNSGGAVKTLRSPHHQLARLIAQGVKGPDIQMITGYTPSRISVLKGDPAFQELVSYYAGQTEEVFVDVHKRMAQVGVMAMEELQTRLEEEPEKIGVTTLMDIIDMTHGPKAKVADQKLPPGQGAPPVSLNITFHAPQARPIDVESTPVVTIEHNQGE